MDDLNLETSVSENEIKSYLKGSIGAIIGSIIGAIPWAIAYYFGWFVGWLGIFIGIASKKGYEALGGKNGKLKVWIISVATIFGIILGNVMGDFFDIGLWVLENEVYGWTLFDVPGLFIDILIEDKEVLLSFFKNLALGFVFGGIAVFSNFKNANNIVNSLDNEAEDLNLQVSGKNPKLQNFTVYFPKANKILFWSIWTIPIFSFLIIFFVFLMEGFDNEGIAIIMFFLVAILLILIPSGLQIYKIQKLIIEVNGNTLNINNAFGKSQTITFNDITKVKIKYKSIMKQGIYGPITKQIILIGYTIDGKKIFKVNETYYRGVNELEQRIKEENIQLT